MTTNKHLFHIQPLALQMVLVRTYIPSSSLSSFISLSDLLLTTLDNITMLSQCNFLQFKITSEHVCISSITHGNRQQNRSHHGQWGIKKHLLTSHQTQSRDILPGCCLFWPQPSTTKANRQTESLYPQTNCCVSRAGMKESHTYMYQHCKEIRNGEIRPLTSTEHAIVSSTGRGYHRNTCWETIHDLVAVLGRKRSMKNRSIHLSF